MTRKTSSSKIVEQVQYCCDPDSNQGCCGHNAEYWPLYDHSYTEAWRSVIIVIVGVTKNNIQRQPLKITSCAATKWDKSSVIILSSQRKLDKRGKTTNNHESVNVTVVVHVSIFRSYFNPLRWKYSLVHDNRKECGEGQISM